VTSTERLNIGKMGNNTDRCLQVNKIYIQQVNNEDGLTGRSGFARKQITVIRLGGCHSGRLTLDIRFIFYLHTKLNNGGFVATSNGKSH
jgi:hypothetical protein